MHARANRLRVPQPVKPPRLHNLSSPQVSSDVYTRELEKAMPLLCRGVTPAAGGAESNPAHALFGERAGALWLLLPCLVGVDAG